MHRGFDFGRSSKLVGIGVPFKRLFHSCLGFAPGKCLIVSFGRAEIDLKKVWKYASIKRRK